VRHEVVELARIFVEKPHLYEVFLEGKPLADERHRSEALATAHLLVNSFAYRLVYLGGWVGGDIKWVERDIATRYATSPFLCEYLETHRHEYPKTGERQMRIMQRAAQSEVGHHYRCGETADGVLDTGDVLRLRGPRVEKKPTEN
jgi:hypothetical protein